MKINRIKLGRIFFVSLVINFTGLTLCSAYDNEKGHPEINENSARQSTLNAVLINSLGLSDGIESVVNGRRLWRWLRQGGTDEDIPDLNVLNHFHDPLQPWWHASLYNIGSSSLVWAQNESYDYSWQKARTYFYEALTTNSEAAYANTFLTLGHLMHLVSDKAVPAHVRADSHLYGSATGKSHNSNG